MEGEEQGRAVKGAAKYPKGLTGPRTAPKLGLGHQTLERAGELLSYLGSQSSVSLSRIVDALLPDPLELSLASAKDAQVLATEED